MSVGQVAEGNFTINVSVVDTAGRPLRATVSVYGHETERPVAVRTAGLLPIPVPAPMGRMRRVAHRATGDDGRLTVTVPVWPYYTVVARADGYRLRSATIPGGVSGGTGDVRLELEKREVRPAAPAVPAAVGGVNLKSLIVPAAVVAGVVVLAKLFRK